MQTCLSNSRSRITIDSMNSPDRRVATIRLLAEIDQNEREAAKIATDRSLALQQFA
jgi:hypothetical protein